jgi:ankyrin repeat protein
LSEAAKRRDGYTAWSLVKAGADVAAKTDTNDNTSLIVAASHGSLVVIDTLLAAGADVTAVNKAGHTALMAAARRYVKVELSQSVQVWVDDG